MLKRRSAGLGPGGPVDSENRSQGAVAYQEKYGKYDAYFIAPSSEKIYLTFDEGYENGFTADILDTLKEKGVHAVFFVTLPYVKEQPELVQRMIDEGHIVGNHSNKHITYPSLSLEEAKEDLMSLHQYMLDTYQYKMTVSVSPRGISRSRPLHWCKAAAISLSFGALHIKTGIPTTSPTQRMRCLPC